VTDAVKVFAAAADATRVRLLQLLLTEERCTAQCAESIEVPPLTLSSHLRVLTDVGLLTHRDDGGRSYYRVTDPRTVARLFADAACLLPRDA
jgi:ArsR family transcriptional regulator